jgi:hypothetical protein
MVGSPVKIFSSTSFVFCESENLVWESKGTRKVEKRKTALILALSLSDWLPNPDPPL